jgi:uncharacterized SAM-binding protein YcdF (DUF218 family)
LALAVGAVAAYLLATAFQVMREANVDEAHPADAIVVFGAAEYVGKDPKFSEGQVGRDYLSKLGVPDVNLIAETQADDTEKSARRVAVILEANELKSALLVSDAYHLYRAKRMMEQQGIQVFISPRPDSIPKTVLGRWLSALREAFSYAAYRLHLT